jgi:hypothetical protein
MNSFDIVKDALSYYDKNNEKYADIKKKISYIREVENPNNVTESWLGFYDSNRNELFRSKVEIIGRYYGRYNVWIWGWALPVDYHYVSTIRQVLLYGTSIRSSGVPGIDQMTLSSFKNELVNSRMKINNKIQLEIHCAIASYLTKIPFIFSIPYASIFTSTDDGNIKNNKDIKYEVFIYVMNPPNLD